MRELWALVSSSTVALAAALACLGGCDMLTYGLHALAGELSIQRQVEPIDDVLASDRLSEEEKEKLRLVIRARQFAVDAIGLNAGDSYTTFYDSADDPLAFSLTVVPRDSLAVRQWWFPIFGTYEHLFFYDGEYLRQIEEVLTDAGFDVYSYQVGAYSTQGFYDDPIRSPMLRYGTISVVETIIHELLHNTIWRRNADVFNESLAMFVGRTGTVEFLQSEFGEDSGWPETATAYYADEDTVNAFLFELYGELEAHYSQPLSSDEKIAGREALYQAARNRFAEEILPTLAYPDSFAWYSDLPTNNAWMRVHYRYNFNLSAFEDVYATAASDWRAALDVFRAAADAPGDPFEYLRNWLTERQP